MQTTKINFNKLLESPVVDQTELIPDLSGRAGYYRKAIVYTLENGLKVLRSYDTLVAVYYKDPATEQEYYAINGKYSATTTVHQRDFLYQEAGVDISARKLDKYTQDFAEQIKGIN